MQQHCNLQTVVVFSLAGSSKLCSFGKFQRFSYYYYNSLQIAVAPDKSLG